MLGHELVDERVERFDPVLGGAAVEDPRSPGVPAGEVAERALALVLVLDLLGLAGSGGQRWVLARSGLYRGFLVGADDVVARMQPLALPAALLEVEHSACLLGEAWVAREDPGAVLPGFDRVL